MTREKAINRLVNQLMSDYDITRKEALGTDEVKLVNEIYDDFEMEKLENKE